MGQAPLIMARWFNGQSSRAQEVLVALQAGPKGPNLKLHALDQAHVPARSFSHHQVEWPAQWSSDRPSAALTVGLENAGSLQIDDPQAWQDALALAGHRPSLTQRMQTHWPVLLAVLIAAAILIGLFYRYGTPWAAAQITRVIPLEWETSLSQRAMEQLDQNFLKPSKIPVQRQEQIRAQFDVSQNRIGKDLQAYATYAPKYTLAFRLGPGANAFALPGGTVVVFDGLIEMATKLKLDDDALMGVLAHEMGHIVHRHTTRLLVEQGVLNVGLGLALGDVSYLLSLSSTLLTGRVYQRQHEAQADCFAIQLMQQLQRPTGPMADLLLGISSSRDIEKTAAQNKPADKSTLAILLSSHPETRQRAEQLKAGQTTGCPKKV
jgi:Zn-dependent protease with chaperone function